MVKKLTKKVINQKCKKKKFFKYLNLISPFYFNESNDFIYNIKFYKDFYKFENSFNNYKPNSDEINFLKNNIQNIDDSFKNSKKIIPRGEINQYLKQIINHIEILESNNTIETEIIKEIMEKRNKSQNITITKIKNILNDKYKINISRASIQRILKNKLKYRYRRTMIKNIDLNKIKYKIMSFIFIKIIIKAMIQNYNFIFIDESNFLLINNHFKTWLKENENIQFGPRKKDKINILLAVSVNKVVNYRFIKENLNRNNFAEFLEATIGKVSKNDIKKTVWIMDNLPVHLCKNVKKIMKQFNLKVLFTVPYQSVFNPIELSFRYIKNIIYKKIHMSINELKNDVINIIEDDKIKETLFKNFIETVKKYLYFLEKNIEIDLDLNGLDS